MRNRIPAPDELDIIKAKINRSSVLLVEGFLGLMLFLLVVAVFTNSCNGPPGMQGIQGVVGPAGPAGETGATTGVPGIAGNPGDAGLRGPVGPAGVQGIAGPVGPAGADTGIVGPAGPVGPIGPAGPAGELGFLNPSPQSLLLPNVNQILFFQTAGVVVENPGSTSLPQGDLKKFLTECPGGRLIFLTKALLGCNGRIRSRAQPLKSS